MKIRFYIFGIVCVFLTCSFASAEWARFSDYENDGGCEFDRCDTDTDCNDGQCHFCDKSRGGNGFCKKGSKYDGKDYGSYEKCKCASRKREWATTENKCCPKGEYNSDGHCCPTSEFFNEIIWNPKSNRCDKCKGVGEGELTCGDTEITVFKCQNGSLVPVETCLDVGTAHRKCENGKCVCSAPPTCDKGRVLNADTCQCECPKDKPFWNGFFCTNRECETAGDCTSIFSDAVEACLRCENNQCKIKTGNICSTDGYVVQTCTADGKISPVSRPCDDNKKCVNGECVCDTEHPMCKVGETKCSEDEKSALECVTDTDKDNCPTWLTHNCAGEKGTGKCVDGKCEYDDCTPGETRCAPDFPEYAIQTCDDTKKWGGITFRENKCFVCKDGKFENAYATEDAQKECECQAKNLKWCPNTKSCSLENGECPSCEAGYIWDTSDEAKASSSGNGAGACCPNGKWNGTACCDSENSYWTGKGAPVCAKAVCKARGDHWDTSDGARNSYNGTTEGACCPDGYWNGTECCDDNLNYWTKKETTVCAKAVCEENGGHWDTSDGARNDEDYGTSDGACCYSWTGKECCSSSYNQWTNKLTEECCKAHGKVMCSDGECTSGCCGDDAFGSHAAFKTYECGYTCNEKTHKYEITPNTRWCPASKQCVRVNKGINLSPGCCNYYWANTLAKNCDDIDAKQTCQPSTKPNQTYYYSCTADSTLSVDVDEPSRPRIRIGTIPDGSQNIPAVPPGGSAEFFEH